MKSIFLDIYQPRSLPFICPFVKSVVKASALGDLQLHKNPRSEKKIKLAILSERYLRKGFIYNIIFPRMIKFRRVN